MIWDRQRVESFAPDVRFNVVTVDTFPILQNLGVASRTDLLQRAAPLRIFPQPVRARAHTVCAIHCVSRLNIVQTFPTTTVPYPER